MHHLHPRSRTTSTLFTTTLAISFLVVGLPHILTCPVDRRQFADAGPGGQPQQRRRRKRKDEVDDDVGGMTPSTAGEGRKAEGEANDRPARECPMPKPSGLVGQIMGFERREKERQVPVVVQSLRDRSRRGEGQGEKQSEEDGPR